jgi:hypothetical protein
MQNIKHMLRSIPGNHDDPRKQKGAAQARRFFRSIQGNQVG